MSDGSGETISKGEFSSWMADVYFDPEVFEQARKDPYVLCQVGSIIGADKMHARNILAGIYRGHAAKYLVFRKGFGEASSFSAIDHLEREMRMEAQDANEA